MVPAPVRREFWIQVIESAWKKRPIVWLSGVRRVGKTVLCQSIPGVEYFDCELPSHRRMMQDPEGFLETLKGKRIVLDEIHRLENPSELLKIAADHYPTIRVIATGSSTLSAFEKFSDTLSGRKRDLWLPPMCLADLPEANAQSLKQRLHRGGLPPFLLGSELDERDFQEWVDSFWAKDITSLFRIERRDSFEKFMELLMHQSGGIFEASSFASPCEVSRPTIGAYLRVLETTFVAHVIRPFHGGKSAEIIAAPKVYGFDTGFVCFHRGWDFLRDDDLGFLWEHFVLNEIMARRQSRELFYWRNKRGHEIDFIIPGKRNEPLAIECKWSADKFDPASLLSFRRLHPEGESVVIARDVTRAYLRNYGPVKVRFESLEGFVQRLG